MREYQVALAAFNAKCLLAAQNDPALAEFFDGIRAELNKQKEEGEEPIAALENMSFAALPVKAKIMEKLGVDQTEAP